VLTERGDDVLIDRIGTAAIRRTALAAWERHIGRPVNPDRLVAELAAGTLPAAFHATATAYPDRPALCIDGETISHGELDKRAARTAGWLRSQGVARGDRVLVSGPNSLALVVSYLGVLRAGATVVLANPTYTETELQHLVGDSGARAAFGTGTALAHLQAIAARGSALRLVAVLNGEGADGPAVAADIAHNADVALLAYTSGTTGRPKGVPLSHANLLSSIRGVMLAWRWQPDDELVHALPLTHQHGLGGVHATLLAGSRAVIHARFDPAALCAAIRAERATVLFAVPAIYERLLAWEAVADADLSSLRLAISGSAPLSPALAERIAALLGQLPLERYGSTEAGLDVSNPYEGPRRVGTVGLPLPGVKLAIVDGTGALVPDGSDGEIVLRGPQVFLGYAGQPDATAAAFYPGGWFRSGDIGRVDPADGYLTITGRAKEVIITGGLNVYPRELELALEEQPGIAQAAVVGVPSERWGEEVVAFVILRPGASVTPEAVIVAVRRRLAPYKCPKRVFVVDRFPLNDMGKVRRDELAMLAKEKDDGWDSANA
jgi:malonyl-CoA/methylmalonyl-CoA synthetase